MGGGAAVGGAQHIALAVADIGQGSDAALAGPPPGGGEQQDRAAGDEAAADAAVGQPVQGDVQPQYRPGDQPHGVLPHWSTGVADSLTGEPPTSQLPHRSVPDQMGV